MVRRAGRRWRCGARDADFAAQRDRSLVEVGNTKRNAITGSG